MCLIKRKPKKVENEVKEKLDAEAKEIVEKALEEEAEEVKGLSLSESIAKGLKYKNQLLTKHEISSWLGHTYGDKIERNERGLTTAPSKGNKKGLPLADTHYAINDDGTKVCFAFVYELEETHSVFLLLKMNEKALKDVKKIYPDVALSAFPKSYKEKWYTVFVDDTFKSKLDLYTLIGYVYKHVFEDDGLSLKASMALAYESAGFAITKKEVADWLKETYSDIEINCRSCYTTPRGHAMKLPLPDTHYRVDGKKRGCFAYVYQLDNGNVFMLLKLNPKAFVEIKKYCKDICLSAFPKSSTKDKWYTAIIDTTFIDKKQVFHLAEYAYLHLFDE